MTEAAFGERLLNEIEVGSLEEVSNCLLTYLWVPSSLCTALGLTYRHRIGGGQPRVQTPIQG